jgi:2-keto-4-pentenoate hydratase/2-oxohepta-3-ene-1,7-dioic acid hydratase in catechol pathway
MKIIRFQSGGSIHHGQFVDSTTALAIEGDIFGSHKVTDRKLKIEKLLAPLIPTTILCIGSNYKQHVIETNAEMPVKPMMFIKSGNTLNNPGDPIPVPKLSIQVDYECELAVIIGKKGKYVSKQNALDYVFGYTIANDVSARDWQKDNALNGGQFARGKSFDGFCPLGPWIITKDELPNPNTLGIKTLLNGKVMQNSSTADMIFDVPTLIESLTSTMTLRPGDIILTGTPQGVGAARTPPVWLKNGDTIAIEIEKIGRLENPVRNEG